RKERLLAAKQDVTGPLLLGATILLFQEDPRVRIATLALSSQASFVIAGHSDVYTVPLTNHVTELVARILRVTYAVQRCSEQIRSGSDAGDSADSDEQMDQLVRQVLQRCSRDMPDLEALERITASSGVPEDTSGRGRAQQALNRKDQQEVDVVLTRKKDTQGGQADSTPAPVFGLKDFSHIEVCVVDSISLSLSFYSHTHTHTHTHIYIYIC
ncbi:hypothetical protein KIPB_012258, partial [Kipferlia bialata]